MLRFRRRSYAGQNSKGDLPKWHIAAKNYPEPLYHYKEIEALCGYTIAWPDGLGHPVQKSVAKRLPKGAHCTKCLKKAKEAEAS